MVFDIRQSEPYRFNTSVGQQNYVTIGWSAYLDNRIKTEAEVPYRVMAGVRKKPQRITAVSGTLARVRQ